MFQAIQQEPFTCAILTLYVCNIFWQLSHGNYGPAWYWFAAAQITVVATWLMGLMGRKG